MAWKDLEAKKNYQRQYVKTDKFKKYCREWRRTPAGRKARLGAAMRRYWRHRTWTDAFKIKSGCVDCGFDKWAEALDFDHKDRKLKKFNLSQKMGLSIEALKKEIEKCEVRCANCHRRITKRRHPNGFK